MNTIKHEVMTKIISEYGEILENLVKDMVSGNEEIVQVIKKIEKMLDDD